MKSLETTTADPPHTSSEPVLTGTILWGLAYFLCSASMLLANKVALHMIPIPAVLCALQYIFCVIVCEVASLFKLAVVEPWSMEKVKSYWLVPCFFALAIFSNNKVLQYANVETFIVFRNTTPMLVCFLDFLLMGKSLPSLRTVFSFVFILVGTIAYAMTDEKFEPIVSLWIVFYLVVITGEMIYVKHIFSSVEMSTWTRVKYTNGLSLLIQPLLAVATREWETYGAINSISLWALFAIFLSCVGGFGISFSGTEFRSRVSATTFTVVGVVNKMLTVTVNYFMWDQHANAVGLVALFVTIVGGVVYQPAPQRAQGSFSDRVWTSLAGRCLTEHL